MTNDIPWVSGELNHLKKWVQSTLEDRDGFVNWETRFNGEYNEDFIRFFVVASSQDSMGKMVENKGPPFGKNDEGEIFELVRSKSGSIAISCCGSACKKPSFVFYNENVSKHGIINYGNLRKHLLRNRHPKKFAVASGSDMGVLARFGFKRRAAEKAPADSARPSKKLPENAESEHSFLRSDSSTSDADLENDPSSQDASDSPGSSSPSSTETSGGVSKPQSQDQSTKLTACPGVLSTEIGFQSGAENFPFALLTGSTLERTLFRTLRTSFDSFRGGDTLIWVTSRRCVGEVIAGRGPCDLCKQLPFESAWKALVERAKENHTHTFVQDSFLTNKQFRQRHKRAIRDSDKGRLHGLNYSRLKLQQSRLQDVQGRVLQALATADNLSHLASLMRRALDKGHGIHRMLSAFTACRKRLSAPRMTDQDYDVKVCEEAMLILRLGGDRLLYAMHKSAGFPSRSFLYKKMIATRATFTSSIHVQFKAGSFQIRADLERNMCNSLREDHGRPRSPHVLMLDGVAMEQRARYAPRSNQLAGLCAEHACRCLPEGVAVTSTAAVDMYAEFVRKNKVHLASEALVIGVGAIRNESAPFIPLLVIPSCKAFSAEHIAGIVEVVLEVWKNHEYGEQLHGPIVTVSSDSASVYRKALTRVCRSHVMPTTVPWSHLLQNLDLFDQRSSVHGVMDCADDKHSAKRWRHCLKRANDSIRVFDTEVDQMILRDFLLLHGKCSEADLERLFHPDDNQNVPAVVSMCERIAELESFDLSCQTALNRHKLGNVLPGVRLIALICRCFHVLLTDHTMSLNSHLQNLSALAHVLFVLYRRNGTKFLPSQTYSSIISFIRSHYNSCAAAQALGCSHYYFFQDNDDREETFFGILRSLIRGSANFDLMQITERINSVQDLQELLMRRPEIDRGSRRLNMSKDKWNTKSWNGVSDPREVLFFFCWSKGREHASEILREWGANDEDLNWDLMKVQGFTITYPKGKALAGDAGLNLNSCTGNTLSNEAASDEAADGDKGTTLDEICDANASATCIADEASSFEIPLLDGVDPDDLLEIEENAEERGVVTICDEPTLEELSKQGTWGDAGREGDDRVVSTISRNFIIKGEEVPKATYIKRAFASLGKTMSTDRLKRVRGYEKGSGRSIDTCSTKPKVMEDQSNDQGFDTVEHHDFAATLVDLAGTQTLAVILIENIVDGNKTLSCVEASRLNKAGVFIKGHIIRLNEVPGTPYLRYNINDPHATVEMINKVEVNGALAVPLRPEISVPSRRGKPQAKFELSVLKVAQQTLTSYSESERRKIPRLAKVEFLPYQKGGENAFAKGASVKGQKERLEMSGVIEKFLCLVCEVYGDLKGESVYVAKRSLREHMAAHIHFHRHLLPPNPCGWCGIESQETCTIKKAANEQMLTHCKTYQDTSVGRQGMRYNTMAAVKKSAANVIVPCPCGSLQWRFNLPTHYENCSQFQGARVSKIPEKLFFKKKGKQTITEQLYVAVSEEEKSILHEVMSKTTLRRLLGPKAFCDGSGSSQG